MGPHLGSRSYFLNSLAPIFLLVTVSNYFSTITMVRRVQSQSAPTVSRPSSPQGDDLDEVHSRLLEENRAYTH